MSVDTLQFPKQGDLSALAAWIAGDLGSALVRLYTSNTPYTPDRVCGDYTEASFVGYAPIGPVAWGAPFINVSGKAETDSPVLTFSFTGAVGSFTVFGVYITDPGQTKLLAVGSFATPVVFDPANPSWSSAIAVTGSSET